MWWHLLFAACSGHRTMWSRRLDNAQLCGVRSQLVVFTNATEHTWPHPTAPLGVVSGATDLNLSTRRGQCNNFDSIHILVWSYLFTFQEASYGTVLCHTWTIPNLPVHPKPSLFKSYESLMSWPCRHMLINKNQVLWLVVFCLIANFQICCLWAASQDPNNS